MIEWPTRRRLQHVHEEFGYLQASCRSGTGLASQSPALNVNKMMRMRGLEPPPDYSDTDLNRIRVV